MAGSASVPEIIISARQYWTNDEFSCLMGLEIDDRRDEPLPFKCVQMKGLFGMEPKHYENFPGDFIGQKAPEDDPESLVTHLVEQMTGIDVKDINAILENKVPKEVNKAVTDMIDLLVPVLKEAWEVTNSQFGTTNPSADQGRKSAVNEDDPRVDENQHVIPLTFYASLHAIVFKKSLKSPSSFLDDILRVCKSSFSKAPFDSSEYHDLWKVVIKKLIMSLIPEYARQVERRAAFRDNGIGRVGFKVYNGMFRGRPHYPVIQSKPDILLGMVSILDLPNGSKCMLDSPVLAVEVKTSYAETASYVPGQTRVTSSSSSYCSIPLPRSNCSLEDDVPVGMEASTMSQRMVTRSSSGKSKSSTQDMKQDDVGATQMKCGDDDDDDDDDNNDDNAGDSSKVDDSVSSLVKRQMMKMKAQHAVQLIGMLKWSSGIVEYANNEITKVKGLENYELKEKNTGALGIFTIQNRVYFTRMSVQSVSGDDRLKRLRDVVTSWAYITYPGWKGEPMYPGYAPKMKISDVYLDIFNPEHLKVFFTFLRVALWGEFQVCT